MPTPRNTKGESALSLTPAAYRAISFSTHCERGNYSTAVEMAHKALNGPDQPGSPIDCPLIEQLLEKALNEGALSRGPDPMDEQLAEVAKKLFSHGFLKDPARRQELISITLRRRGFPATRQAIEKMTDN